MKKILCLALALLMCASLMIACGDDPAPEVDDLKAFTDALAASAPKTAKVNTTLESALGELNAEYSVTYGEDGTAELVFTLLPAIIISVSSVSNCPRLPAKRRKLSLRR